VTGEAPGIWRADMGASTPVSYRIEGEETVVPLDFGAENSFFVAFRKPAPAASLSIAPQPSPDRFAMPSMVSPEAAARLGGNRALRAFFDQFGSYPHELK
jgi:hypothetical protein